MNSVPNNDSKQCTESKPGWVHQVHTLAQLARTLRRVVGLACPCRRPSLAVSQAWPGRVVAPSRQCRRHRRSCRRPARPCRRLYRDTPSTKAMRARRVACCRGCRSPKRRIVAHRGHVAACIAAILRYKSRPYPQYKVCIVTRPLVKPCARALSHAPRVGLSYRGLLMVVSWRRLGRVVEQAQPCRGRVLAVSWSPGYAQDCCVTIQFHCILTQMGSSPSSFCF